ncbi:methyltransferase-like protein 25B isoform X2 [Patella vulgata]|nr:methyltransferase-like protein 25B isoform X2 [Patella vulgata]
MERDINKVINRLKKEEEKTESMTSDQIKSCDELPNHVVCTISSDISAGEFVKVLNNQSSGNELDLTNSALETDNENFSSANVVDRETRNDNFILGGLHACGDLTPTLLRVFASCDKTVGLASVGCCYMKLTSRSDNKANINQSKEDGYPMSQFVQSLPEHQLSYAAREMACHFADSYKERLKADSEHLKVHCYRAAFQHIITILHPEFDRGAMKLTIKNATNMPFENYCSSVLKKLGYDDTIPSELMKQAKEYLSEWKNVMSFYTVRLSLGPVVETLILLDRLIYLYEQGLSSVLVPIFDPSLSPRNFLLLANKNNKS